MKYRFSSLRFDFLTKIEHIKYESLRLKFDSSQTQQLSSEQSRNHRISKAFFKNNENLLVSHHLNREQPSESSQNSVENSWESITLPFSSNDSLRMQFQRFQTNFIRVGRCLELIDYMASNVAYSHAQTD
jgi:acyl-coenzyme A thioesterase 9